MKFLPKIAQNGNSNSSFGFIFETSTKISQKLNSARFSFKVIDEHYVL